MKPDKKNPTIFVAKKKRFKETCFTQSFRTFSMFFGAMIAFGVFGDFGVFGVLGDFGVLGVFGVFGDFGVFGVFRWNEFSGTSAKMNDDSSRCHQF